MPLLTSGYFIIMRENKNLYCIVCDPKIADEIKPDISNYSPKELAAKENTTPTSVYSWIKNGLPCMRHGDKGDILINYQDYIQWMIDSARSNKPIANTPAWAFRFVKSTSPRLAKFDPITGQGSIF